LKADYHLADKADPLGQGDTQDTAYGKSTGKDRPFWDALNKHVKNLHAVVSGHGISFFVFHALENVNVQGWFVKTTVMNGVHANPRKMSFFASISILGAHNCHSTSSLTQVSRSLGMVGMVSLVGATVCAISYSRLLIRKCHWRLGLDSKTGRQGRGSNWTIIMDGNISCARRIFSTEYSYIAPEINK
jgi:hypothetical protein